MATPTRTPNESSRSAVRIGLASGRRVAVTPLAIFDDVGDTVYRLPGTSALEIAEGIARLLDNPEFLVPQEERVRHYWAARVWPRLSGRLIDIIDALANPLPG